MAGSEPSEGAASSDDGAAAAELGQEPDATATNTPEGSKPLYNRPYLDATTWIDFLAGPDSASSTPERASIASEIFEAAEQGQLKIVASTVIAVEVLKDPEVEDPDLADIPRFLRRSSFVWVNLDLPRAEEARLLARKFSLKVRDAIHLAAAVEGGADVLLTSNTRDLKPGNYEGMPVREPYFPHDRRLDLPGPEPSASPAGAQELEGYSVDEARGDAPGDGAIDTSAEAAAGEEEARPPDLTGSGEAEPGWASGATDWEAEGDPPEGPAESDDDGERADGT